MHKDPNLRKRNALVIPGGLIALFSFLGILYAAAFRDANNTCGASDQIVLAGACRSALVVLAIPLIIGLAMAGADAAIARSGVSYPVSPVLGGMAGLGLSMLIPFALLYAGQVRNPCCAAKG